MKKKFHFVLSNVLKEKIINYSSINNTSYSRTVVYIIGIMKIFLIKNFYMDYHCDIGRYSTTDADTDLNVYLDSKDYIFLKQIHSNLKTFSIALLIRWMLEKYFEGLNKYGIDKFKKMIKKYKVFFLKNIKHNEYNLSQNKKISKNIKKQSVLNRYIKLQNKTKHMYSREFEFEHIKLVLSNKFNFLRLEFI